MANFTFELQASGKDMANQYFTLDLMEPGAAAEIREKVCMAGARVLIEKLQEYLQQNTNDPNRRVKGTLAKSLTATVFEDGSVIVGPKGKHHGTGVGRKTRAEGYHRPKTGQGTSHLRKHHGLTNAVSAVDVGYYLEYGTPRMSAEHWMETTLEQNEDEVLAAMQAAWNEYLESKGL